MQVFRKILCPVDFSDFSRLALRYAAAMAAENDAQLLVYHVVPDVTHALSHLDAHCPGMMEELAVTAEIKLEQFIGEIIPAELDILQRIDIGDPAKSILQVSGDSVDLIVMGTHGRTGYEKFFLGSVTNKILHQASAPVLTVCNPTHHFLREGAPRAIEIHNIVCALDLRSSPEPIARTALSLARLYRSMIHFVHVVEKSDKRSWGKQQNSCLMRLREVVVPENENWCEVRLVVEPGEPVSVISSLVERENADLLVLGHHARSFTTEIFVGSVAKKMVAVSACPVLVFRSLIPARKDVVLL